MFTKRGNGPWPLAVHLLEKGRQEGIKDVNVYNFVLKASPLLPPALPALQSLNLPTTDSFALPLVLSCITNGAPAGKKVPFACPPGPE